MYAVIAKVHKANKAAVAQAKAAVELPPEDPREVRRKDVYFKTHKLAKEEKKQGEMQEEKLT